MAARFHLIIDIKDVATDALSDKTKLEHFLLTFPAKIGMNILHGPVVVQGIPENPGLTGFVIIDYSHISVHTFSNTKQAFIDIFSCKPYEQDDAVAYTCSSFNVDASKTVRHVVTWGDALV